MNGFDLIREERIDEINATAREYRHEKTGARILSMLTKDTNKVFGITFRTPPSDSTGVAHILEHSVLCGSKKYPVKEPFVELLKGSVQTFLNAFTYPDKTCYPVASENLKDFYNLMDVYLDAVFYPHITDQIFQQEGWHYELESPDAPLTYKGVVYNEMKGAYSNPEDVLSELSQQVLFPDNTYGCDSGGDPKHIPGLTYRQLKDFHTSLYHPSNSYIYFYGDDDPEERLRRINDYLNSFEARDPNSSIEEQGPLAEPIRMVRKYDPGEEGNGDARCMFSINWLWPRITDADANLALGILAYTLIGTSAGPLRKALIDSGLGEDLTGPGFAGYLLQIYFGTGLRGIRSDDIEPVEKLIWTTLESLAKDGIDREILEASFNTFEFRMRESNSGGFPRGLSYMLSALNFWLYDGDPLEPLKFEGPLQRVRSSFDNDQRFFEKLIEDNFLNNTHRAVVIMEPEAGYSRLEENAETEKLAKVRSTLTDSDKQKIIADTESLIEMQEAPDSLEALATIPALGREDVSDKNKIIPIEEDEAGSVPVYTHDLFTNGILYLDIGFNLAGLPKHLLPYLSLFSTAILEMGTAREDFVSLSNRIGKNTGGIGASPFCSSVRGAQDPACHLIVRGKAVLSKTKDLLDILRDVFTIPKLDHRDRFKQIVLEEKAEFEASIIPGGSGIADTRLRSGFSISDWVSEQFRGVSQLFFLRELENKVDEDWDQIHRDLEQIREFVITKNRLLLNVTLPRDDWQRIKPEFSSFVGDLPSSNGGHAGPSWSTGSNPAHEGLTIPAKVNYVTKGINLFDQGYNLHGSISAVTNLLRAGYLWEKVRVLGGAYGANCGMDPRNGVFSFTSYRDPNLDDTVSVYDAAASFLQEIELSSDELTKSVIGAIGKLDSYRLPDALGYTSMVRRLVGETDETLQEYREQLLSTTAKDVCAFGEILSALGREGTVVAVGAHETLSAATSIFGDPPNLTRIL